MLTNNLKKIISDCWSDFQEYKGTNPKVLVNPSIPILWFGDIEEYRKSNLKVVTIGLNPSNIEFAENNKSNSEYEISLRFKKACGLQDVLDDNDIRSYYEAMNDYFNIENEPYKRWFDNFERPMKALNCSYYPNEVPNRAIHIDIYAPVATNPTWGKLSKIEKGVISNPFMKYFDLLREELQSDLMLISVNAGVLFKTFGKKKDSADYTKKYHKGNGFIRAYRWEDKLLISGLNMGGIPFGGMCKEFIKENISCIVEKYKIKL